MIGARLWDLLLIPTTSAMASSGSLDDCALTGPIANIDDANQVNTF